MGQAIVDFYGSSRWQLYLISLILRFCFSPGSRSVDRCPPPARAHKSRQDALQATLWVFTDILYPPNWGCLKKTEFFNRHALITIAIAECRRIGFVFGRIP